MPAYCSRCRMHALQSKQASSHLSGQPTSLALPDGRTTHLIESLSSCSFYLPMDHRCVALTLSRTLHAVSSSLPCLRTYLRKYVIRLSRDYPNPPLSEDITAYLPLLLLISPAWLLSPLLQAFPKHGILQSVSKLMPEIPRNNPLLIVEQKFVQTNVNLKTAQNRQL